MDHGSMGGNVLAEMAASRSGQPRLVSPPSEIARLHLDSGSSESELLLLPPVTHTMRTVVLRGRKARRVAILVPDRHSPADGKQDQIRETPLP